jgi:hypothetical protein
VIPGKSFQPVELRIDYVADRRMRKVAVLLGRGISFEKFEGKE